MTNETAKLATFDTREEAIEWMVEMLHDDEEYCIDNVRFAFVDDAQMVAAFDEAEHSGCCACFNSKIMVGNREAIVGCNYGH